MRATIFCMETMFGLSLLLVTFLTPTAGSKSTSVSECQVRSSVTTRMLDRDKDGKVSLAEWNAAVSDFIRRNHTNNDQSYLLRGMADEFRDIDRNGDGYIEQNEAFQACLRPVPIPWKR